MENCQIIDFEQHHAAAFKQLNLQWMSQLWDQEQTRDSVLDNPQTEIIDQGGAIKIALLGQKVVGTCALIKQVDDSYEMAKTCVSKEARGQGLGERLVAQSIEQARALGASKITLKTATALQAAIALYKKMGFTTISDCGTADSRCDIEMELMLAADSSSIPPSISS